MKILNILLILLSTLIASFNVYAAKSNKLLIPGENHKIPAILTLPQHSKNQKLPIVIMLHGTASQKNEVGDLYVKLAQRLAAQGIASVRFDFIGSGESDVDYRKYNLKSAVSDVVSVYQFIKSRSDINNKNVHLVGFSQGGLIAQLSATTTQIPLVSMVTWSSVAGNGVSSFKAFFDQYYQQAIDNGYAEIKYPWLSQPLKFDKSWFEQVAANSSLTDMANYKGKLLAIAAQADKTVPWQNSVALIKGAKQAQSSLYVIKNANHIFNVLSENDKQTQTAADELLGITTYYLSEQVK
ncbi:alpha/beta fold hydrolase [Pseudoalteromonas sp. MMG010]|uniref:alpha/beta hydrolase family protein n=1 Tax=Pseudoalteromonas sp. MMG010 TaxID=2822685 RepID=UPI001B3A0265|nr:alpha/beta fold hydrolase [Pseudoalteromonas sp. MMG010]MBQ4832074.1 alpha/beta fold hydrolase [Pseudoalteromonas sp. MMG010]